MDSFAASTAAGPSATFTSSQSNSRSAFGGIMPLPEPNSP